MRSHQLLVVVAAVFAGASALGYVIWGQPSGPAAGPDDYVLAVPGMH